MTLVLKSKLPRLPREFYRGDAMALWTHTFRNRATGWLTGDFHRRFREILLHASCRQSLVCPCYVLMPDHFHLVWVGFDEHADQWLATAFLRKHLGPFFGTARLQDRAHDHVLREDERRRGAFQAACGYVRLNPERAGLCADWRAWPFAGVMIPGYPELDARAEDFWEKFWKIRDRLASPQLPALTRRATPCSPLREERYEP